MGVGNEYRGEQERLGVVAGVRLEAHNLTRGKELVYPLRLVGSEGRGDGFVGFGDTLVIERGARVDYGGGTFHIGLGGGGDRERGGIPHVEAVAEDEGVGGIEGAVNVSGQAPGGDADSEADNLPLVGLGGGRGCDGLEHRGLRNVELENPGGGGGQAPVQGEVVGEEGVRADTSVREKDVGLSGFARQCEEEQREGVAGSYAAMLQGGEEVFGEENVGGGAEGVAVAVENVQGVGVVNGGIVADGEGEVGIRLARRAHRVLDERSDIEQGNTAAVGIEPLGKQGYAAGGCEPDIDKSAVDADGDVADLRGKGNSCGLVDDAVSHKKLFRQR